MRWLLLLLCTYSYCIVGVSEMVLINSPGGVGTTELMQKLRRYGRG